MRGRPISHVLLLPASSAAGCSLIAWLTPGVRTAMLGGPAAGAELPFLLATLACQVAFIILLAEWIHARYTRGLRRKAARREQC